MVLPPSRVSRRLLPNEVRRQMLRNSSASWWGRSQRLLVARVRVAVHSQDWNVPTPNHVAATAAKKLENTPMPHETDGA